MFVNLYISINIDLYCLKFCARCYRGNRILFKYAERSSTPQALPVTSPLSQHTTPPVSPPIYPSVLKDRHSAPLNLGSPSNIRAPPPVPPRGVRAAKRYQGFGKGAVIIYPFALCVLVKLELNFFL